MSTTSIEWTERTWNPVTGCDKVSSGCKHCYAETIADRFWATQYPRVPLPQDQQPVIESILGPVRIAQRPRRFTDVQTHEDRLLEPLKWRKPAKVFVNSMSDLFHKDVPDEFIDCVFNVMAYSPQHTFQVLTKRPERMRQYLSTPDRGALVFDGLYLARIAERHGRAADDAICRGMDRVGFDHGDEIAWPLHNVWLGVSVENQQYADARIPHLLQTPAAVRFISAEPLLGPVDLSPWVALWRCDCGWWDADGDGPAFTMSADSTPYCARCGMDISRVDRLDWCIVGGESGAGARPMVLAWVRSLVQQCQSAGVPPFYKQGGSAHRCEHSSKGGCLDCAPEDLRIRQYPRLSPEGDV